jgi:DNA polymerase III subunit delta
LKLLEDLINTGEPLLRLTFMIRRQFQLVARASALLERGTPQKEVASLLKVPPFVARKLEEQAHKLDGEDLERALNLVLGLESGLKGGNDLSDELQVEMTVLKLSDAPR